MEKETYTSERKINDLKRVIEKAVYGEDVSKYDIALMLNATGDEELNTIFTAADEVRRRYVGDEIHFRGIVEFSNYCRQNCLYCGLRKDNGKLERYRMSPDEIIASARRIKEANISTIVLQSGEDYSFHRKKICEIVDRIKAETGLIITLSLGERSYEDYLAFKKAGADRYLLKHETSSRLIHEQLRPGASFANRIKCLHWLKQLGYEVGTGIMVGLPFQDENSLAEDIIFMKKISADMLGIGPFIPHPETPLAECKNGDVNMVLKVIAVARLITKTTNIPATTALGALNPALRVKALCAGANVIMPDFTPREYKELYDIYPGKTNKNCNADNLMPLLKETIGSIGRVVG